MKLTTYFVRLLLLTIFLVACGAELPIELDPTPINENEQIEATPTIEEVESTNVLKFGDSAIKKTSGLTYEDITIGEGATANINDVITIHYTGYLEDGMIFDNSLSGDPYSFLLGAKQVILGWEEGLAGMSVGGKRKLLIPSNLAYGQQEIDKIPAGSNLIFEVELLEVESLPSPTEVDRYLKKPSGIKLAVIQEGEGNEAKIGDSITYDYNAWLENGILYDSSSEYGQPVQAILGEGALASFDEGIDGMKVGEIRQLRLSPELAYGEQGIENYVPPNSTVIFEVHLLENATALALTSQEEISQTEAAGESEENKEEATKTAIPEEATKTATPEEATKTATPEEATKTATPEEATKTATPEEATKTATPEEATKTATPEEQPTETAILLATSSPTLTTLPTLTSTPRPTWTKTALPISTATKTAFSTPTKRATRNALATSISRPTSTKIIVAKTALPTSTKKPTSTAVLTPTKTIIATSTKKPTSTAVLTPTKTIVATSTALLTPTKTIAATSTALLTPTKTIAATSTKKPTSTAVLTPTKTIATTSTPKPTSTSRLTVTKTIAATSTAKPTSTVVLAPSKTAVATSISQPTLTKTAIVLPTSTKTAIPTEIVTSTTTSTATPISTTPVPTLFPTSTPREESGEEGEKSGGS